MCNYFTTAAKVMCFFVTVLFSLASVTLAQSGSLDPTFGSLGKMQWSVSDSGSYVQAVAQQPDGKLITAGFTYHKYSRIFLMRFKTDGLPDSSFGTNGIVLTSMPLRTSWANAVVVQQDGRILIGGFVNDSVGSAYTSFLLISYLANGTIDSSFGNNGISTLSFTTSNAAIQSIVVKTDGKIVVGGHATFPLNRHDFVIAQFHSNGRIDSSFGTNGRTIINVLDDDNVKRIILKPGGKILVGGFSTVITGTRNNYFVLAQCHANGKVDSSFGQNGIVTNYVSDGKNDAYDIALQPDKKILIAGTALHEAVDKFAVVRYDSVGRIDSSFGVNGMATSMIEVTYNAYNAATNIHVQPAGSILLTGFCRNDLSLYNFSLMKLKASGAVDSSFGTNGAVVTDFNGTNDFSRSSLIQPDGKIVLAGITDGSPYATLALARYHDDIVLPLKLISFTAKKQAGKNQLLWQTTAETNVSHYMLERSKPGANYTSLVRIPAGAERYTYTDEAPYTGFNYYRIKIISKDGSYEYSPVRMIDNSRSLYATIYPNPAMDKVQLQIDSDKKSDIQLQIMTADGKAILSKGFNVQQGHSVKTINISSLAKGSYLIQMSAENGERFVLRFQKL